MTRGTVYLVGAGPGDPGLLTVRGKRLLEQADCVVYDKLVDPRILEFAPARAERAYVGKQANSSTHCTPQAQINRLLIDRAGQGQRVVRLKGGDPLLFARGAEEAEALQEAGIDHEIVPGVTAALAAAATASIPLTHRHHASAVAFVTGHEDLAKGSRLDWQALARFPGTLVVYMGLTRIGEIASELIARGKPTSTPAALVEWGGGARQKVVSTTIGDLATSGPPAALASPTLALIGAVCAMRDTLGWFERRPLFGQSVLVTRPARSSDALASRLEELGAEVIHQPVFRIEPTDDWGPVDRAIDCLENTDWIVFASSNGVERFCDRLFELGHDLRRFGRARIAVIGPGTDAALRRYHLKADLLPDEFRAEALVDALRPLVPGKRVLLVRADRGRDLIRTQLTLAGARVESIVAYRQIDLSEPDEEVMRRLRGGSIRWAMLSSSKTAQGFLAWLRGDSTMTVTKGVGLVTISPLTSQAVREAGFEVTVEADEYTFDGMIEALVDRVTSTATRFPFPAK